MGKLSDSKTLVSIENVKKHYPLKRKALFAPKQYLKAVNGVTLDIIQGETMGVVGESGCGKSTLGRSILHLEKLTEGSITFNDTNLSELNPRELKYYRKDMQMIFQDPFASLDPRQKVGDVLEEPMIIHTNLSKTERREKVKSLLEEVGLRKNHVNRFPHEFSGGQRQRIGIGRAIALNPKFIVCDEPVSALDVSVQAQIIKLLQELQNVYDLTYLFISHDLGVVRYICDRVLVMYLGHMVELAPVEKLYENPKHPYTKILLSAIPRVNLEKKPKKIKTKGYGIEGVLPGEGCVFAPRCPLATVRCTEKIPVWREVDDGHFIACHEV